ncbi:TrkH family potassium uptake protein [Paenibacillus sambharensis]|uniref:TrkH family potassium uptake protein n=1 Tax=Paenibacillus sambharensis TaxID=1803190 RepID=A0A2W1LLH7_9BACL|nr:potassium transporter TrkG [Paenibacillus sambharensis]PZD95735.1 TrkH family potassium uptake protein [Paenibacillus sambharensis]
MDLKTLRNRVNRYRTSLRGFVTRLTPTQFIVLGYLIAVSLSTVLLKLPVSLREGAQLSWMDALFTATSAVSVTGLTVVSTAATFSGTGKVMLLFMFQLGGIGIMTLGAFLWLVLGRNISLSYRRLIMVDQNRHNLSGLVYLMRLVFLIALGIEAVGAVLLTVYFRAAGYADNWLSALLHGTFHSISAFTNAGFDIYGDSLYRFANDYVVQGITMLLLILGAIGFPVLIEVSEYLFGKHKQFRFSLYTKMTGAMFFVLVVLGAIGIWFFEHNLHFETLPWHEQIFFSLFNSISTRSGGLATMDINAFSVPSLVLLSVLMFIGASPSSVGGGVRTTTFGVILLTLFNYALGRSEVRAFKRAIKQEDVTKSFVVFTAAALLVLMGIMVLGYTETGYLPLMAIVFEVCSAFGTSGLSMGITPTLSTEGKCTLIIIMFIGRIGMLSLLFMFRSRRSKQHYHYPKEDLIIG